MDPPGQQQQVDLPGMQQTILQQRNYNQTHTDDPHGVGEGVLSVLQQML